MEKRVVEVFSAGCYACTDIIEMVRDLACDSCEVVVRDVTEPDIAQRAIELQIRSLPAVVVDGELASCCTSRGPTEEALRRAGVGKAA